MDRASARASHLPQLDGLRFVAFLLVFIHNAPFLEKNRLWSALHNHGWIGVDLFFCLSAYLLTNILVDEVNINGKINIKNFYFRRILRIWPLYFLYIALALWLSIKQTGWDRLPFHLAGLFTFSFNIFFIVLFPKAIVLLVHLWSISYESQFYFVIPWVIQIIKPLSRKTTWIILGFFIIVFSMIRVLFVYFSVDYPAIYVLPVTRFEPLLFGIMLGLGILDRLFEKIPNSLLYILLIAALFALSHLPNIYENDWGQIAIYPVSGWIALIILALTVRKQKGVLQTVLAFSPIRNLGRISYGLYMFHLVGISTTNKLLSTINIYEGSSPSRIIMLVSFSLILTILMALISFNYFERFFLSAKDKYKTVSSKVI